MKRLARVTVVAVVLAASSASWGVQQADLVWQDNSTTETGFRIYRKLGAAGTPAEVGTVGPNVVAFTDNGPLLDGTQYCWIVRAFNAVGEAARVAGDEGCAISGAVPAGATGVNVNIRVLP